MRSVIRKWWFLGGPSRSPDAEPTADIGGFLVARAGVLMRSVIRKWWFLGGPGRSPTCDLRVRSALLYATELPGHLRQWGTTRRIGRDIPE
jgi:hypothetical protein